jgi:hypothetical protein
LTTFVMGHGHYAPPDTFVPVGMSVGVYADVDTRLAITLGMAVLDQPGGYSSRTTTDSKAPIRNYQVEALSHPEYQKMATVASPSNNIVYVGYSAGFDSPTYLCTGDEESCADGVHDCLGLLATIDDLDIRLVFCLEATADRGLSGMTADFPDDPEYDTHRQYLQDAKTAALEWLSAMQQDVAMVESFRALERDPDTAPDAAYILASHKPLDDFLLAYDARQQRLQLNPQAFANYLDGLPPEAQETVRKALQDDPLDFRQSANWAMTPVEGFLGLFGAASAQERYDAWTALDPDQQTEARQARVVAVWAQMVVPVIDYYLQARAAGKPEYDFAAVGWRLTGLTEEQEAEARESDAYNACVRACQEYADTLGPEAKLALWGQLDEDGRYYLKHFTRQTPDDWKLAAAAAAAKPAEIQQEQPQPVAAKDIEDSDDDDFVVDDDEDDFWDAVDADNTRAVGRLELNAVVTVLQADGRFKLVAGMTTELKKKFPDAKWGTFTVTAVTFNEVTLTQKDVTGFDVDGFLTSVRGVTVVK